MTELLNGLKRTNMCGTLRKNDEGREVVVMGFVQKTRDLGNLVFVDLRDRTGIVQLAFDAGVNPSLTDKARSLRGEFVVAAKGAVRLRTGKNINENMPTGEVEIDVGDLKILSEAEIPPFVISEKASVGENLALKYRYLELRKAYLQSNLIMRDKITRAARDYLSANGFLEIETPFLGKSTPEGARDYLVPSRIKHGAFYALPQSPQLYKQLLMIAGFDRYYQIARCFRDEDLRANRQPEFTQIDIEMSFVEEDEDVMAIAEGMIKEVFAKCKNITFTKPFRRMTWAEAMNRFGSDKPDTRFGLELHDISSAVKNTEFSVFRQALETGSVRAICIRGGADKFTRKEIDGFSDFVKDYGAKGLAWASKKEDGSTTSSFYKFLTEKEIADIEEILSADKGDLILAVADKKNKVVFDSLGALRVHIADKLHLYDKNEYDILWVTEFPLLEWSDEDNRFYAMHHPFTCVNVKDLDKIDSKDRDVLASIRANAYDLVINGQEAGGGSIRIHTPEMQRKMFEILGMSEETIKNRFGFFVDAFKYGAPPHGGLAFGLDRLVMLITGDDNIKDVIAFPKVQNASCLMTGAPDFVEEIQLKELGLDVPEEDK
ncbi:MAG: aspartate--tRNA ligase [Eubacteriales bacterium]|nr:aspartate--tRNA ligase [Christensenellaceae bacterium]MDY2750726.1 aspartate--tRNA ligase [Eubacteriales bacterium]